MSDLTGYPQTSSAPFTQSAAYPLISTVSRGQSQAVEVMVGLFEPLAFVSRQRFKNYFLMNLRGLHINYQQQPFLRFVDALTNQLILFAMEPESLRRYERSEAGPFRYPPFAYTEEQVRKMLFESLHPFFTLLQIEACDLTLHFNSHPHDQAIPMQIARLRFHSQPYQNPQKVQVQGNKLAEWEREHGLLRGLRGKAEW